MFHSKRIKELEEIVSLLEENNSKNVDDISFIANHLGLRTCNDCGALIIEEEE